ncbi:MAG: transcriptional regulator [Chloroflexi bacterium]|nr:MAG: transcriptional regulator [Chloroflexota bacterium]
MSVSEANDASGRTGFDREVERLALLEDPVRRALYRHVVRQGDYVSRDDAATALGIARGLAAFHLDKLAHEDLLEFIYRRPDGRTGPGAGRPAKLYRRSRQEVAISLPHRDYRLLADLLAAALAPAAPEDVRERFVEGAHRSGAELAADARRLAGRRPSRRRLVEVGLEVLRRQGFDPYACGGEVTLRNCPFEAVARAHPALVCPMNRALVEGFVEALNVRGMSVTCEPGRDGCCVTLRFDS